MLHSLVFLVIFLTPLQGASAQTEHRCLRDQLLSLLKTPRGDYGAAPNLSQVQALRWQSDLAPSQRAEQAYEIALDARLHNLSPPERAQLKAKLRSQTEVLHSIDPNGKYLGGHITVGLPAELHDTFLMYLIKRHETEHYLRYLEADGRIGPGEARKLMDAADAELRSAFEAIAMHAEGEYLLLIPREDRQALLEDLPSL